ncbi:P-type conjugative transfer ATPase TrbB (plasmid) [Legionella sp. PC1000]|nr:P-type conjugative transfer ATPase TrbB [Legionella sp. PC1000]
MRQPLPFVKKALSIFSLDEYVLSGVMSKEHCEAIKKAIATHRNILVIGGTGSGKTTLVNAIINEMVLFDPTERVFIIEDTVKFNVPLKTACNTTQPLKSP